MALFGGKTPAQLTLSDAIMTGFRMVTQVNFVVPILIIGIIVNAIVIVAVLPFIVGLIVHGIERRHARPSAAPIVTSIVGALIGGIIGGLLLNLYGQVWATMASVGEATDDPGGLRTGRHALDEHPRGRPDRRSRGPRDHDRRRHRRPRSSGRSGSSSSSSRS